MGLVPAALGARGARITGLFLPGSERLLFAWHAPLVDQQAAGVNPRLFGDNFSQFLPCFCPGKPASITGSWRVDKLRLLPVGAGAKNGGRSLPVEVPSA